MRPSVPEWRATPTRGLGLGFGDDAAEPGCELGSSDRVALEDGRMSGTASLKASDAAAMAARRPESSGTTPLYSGVLGKQPPLSG